MYESQDPGDLAVLIDRPGDRFPHDEHIWLLLDRYLDGDPTAADAVHRWLADDPVRAGVLSDLRAIREAAALRASPRQVDAAWDRFRAAVDARPGDDMRPDELTIHPGRHGRIGAHRQAPAWRWRDVSTRAATVLLFAGSAWWARMELGTSGTGAGPQPQVFVSAAEELTDIRLTDGTRVTLAPKSRLTVPAGFDSTTREVTLDGRGYFDVKHGNALPFIVHVKNVMVRDFGTKFAIRGYSADTAVRVLVTEGKATVRSELDVAMPGDVLEKGMEATLNASGASSVRAAVDTAQALDWHLDSLAAAGSRHGETVRSGGAFFRRSR